MRDGRLESLDVPALRGIPTVKRKRSGFQMLKRKLNSKVRGSNDLP